MIAYLILICICLKFGYNILAICACIGLLIKGIFNVINFCRFINDMGLWI